MLPFSISSPGFDQPIDASYKQDYNSYESSYEADEFQSVLQENINRPENVNQAEANRERQQSDEPRPIDQNKQNEQSQTKTDNIEPSNNDVANQKTSQDGDTASDQEKTTTSQTETPKDSKVASTKKTETVEPEKIETTILDKELSDILSLLNELQALIDENPTSTVAVNLEAQIKELKHSLESLTAYIKTNTQALDGGADLLQLEKIAGEFKHTLKELLADLGKNQAQPANKLNQELITKTDSNTESMAKAQQNNEVPVAKPTEKSTSTEIKQELASPGTDLVTKKETNPILEKIASLLGKMKGDVENSKTTIAYKVTVKVLDTEGSSRVIVAKSDNTPNQTNNETADQSQNKATEEQVIPKKTTPAKEVTVSQETTSSGETVVTKLETAVLDNGAKEIITSKVEVASKQPITFNQSLTERIEKQTQIIKQFNTFIALQKINDESELTLKLQPRNLGDIKIQIIKQENANNEATTVIAKFQVGSEAVKEALESNFNQLKESLEDSNGFNLASFEVDVQKEDQDGNSFADFFKQDSSTNSKVGDLDENENNGNTLVKEETHVGVLDSVA
jgi:flagellar hook-length control protein FliK